MQKRLNTVNVAGVLLLLIPLLLAFSCPTGTTDYPDTRSRVVDSFTGVAVEGAFDVVLQQGKQQAVVLDGQNLKNVITEVKKGILYIKMDDDVKRNQDVVKVRITVAAIQRVEIAGSGSVRSSDAWGNNGKLVLSVAGSGSITLPLACTHTEAGIAGSGKIITSGSCDSVSVDIAGSGAYDGKELITQTTQVSIAGSGSALVYATETMQGDVAGSGDIKVWGEPKELKKSVAGSGSIKRM